MATQTLNMLPMKTNEQRRNEADRRIPLNIYDIFYEFMGNMKGTIQKVMILGGKFLIFYNDDEGFDASDKIALFLKNGSGSNNNQTTGLNGHGIKLAIDRILPTGEVATVYSINDEMKCHIGKFEYTEWESYRDDERARACLGDYNKGSLFLVPLNDEYVHKIKQEGESRICHACLKFLNIKIAKHNVKFYWNNMLLDKSLNCADLNCIQFSYSLGYDTQSNGKRKPDLIIRINNYESLSEEIRNIIPEYCRIHTKIQRKDLIEYQLETSFTAEEDGDIKLNVDKNEPSSPRLPADWMDGCQIYINNCNINLKAIHSCLGARTANGVFGKDTYDGHPRFENHITKDSKQYDIPADKANIQPTPRGKSVLKYIQLIAKAYYKPTTEVQPAPAPAPEPEPEPEPESISDQHQDILDVFGAFTASRNMSDKLRMEIWIRAFGNKFFGECFCCERILQANWRANNSGALEIGHIIPWSQIQENKWDNLLPICKACNGAMNNTNMDEWMLRERPQQLQRYNTLKQNYLNSQYDPNNPAGSM